MSAVIWLDVVLIVLGLLALGPRLWRDFRRRRGVGPIHFGRGKPAAVLLFYLGLGILATAGVDIGLAEWEKVRRSKGADWDAAFAAFVEAHRSRGPIDPEASPKPEAPDFRLPALDEDRSIRLGDFRGHKPVVLIFGSFG